jgi:tetratricopeptide (TPR) repeat protein
MRYFLLLFSIFILFSCEQNSPKVNNELNQTVSAEEALKQAVKQYPDSIPLLQNLVAYYSNGENYDAALAVINNSIARDSSNPAFWDIRSVIASQKGDTAQAIFSLQRAIDIYPIPDYIISLGALYAETKNPMALTVADALLAANKAQAEKEAYFIKGLYYSFANQKEKAIPFFDKCIYLNYSFVDAYLEKALALYDLKNFAEAAKVLEKAVTIQNSFERGYYYLGQCYEKLNRTTEAIEVYQKALLYDEDYIEVKDALGRLGIK